MHGWLLTLGVAAWVAALWFAAHPTIDLVDTATGSPLATPSTAPTKGANVVAAGASAGFAIAGGLCFLGAALNARQLHKPDRAPWRTDFVAVLDQLRFTGLLTDAEYQAMRQKLAVDRSAGDGPMPGAGSEPA
jgi:hypothetical protein